MLYMNHEVDAQQNPGDYAPEDAGKYVCQELQADDNGFIVVDMTEYDKQDLNGIVLPWDNSNKGTVWYILLTQGELTGITELNAAEAKSFNGKFAKGGNIYIVKNGEVFNITGTKATK
jgi:hypothetical protein